MIELSPSIPDIVEYQLPEQVLSQDTELFVAFLKYYYTWLTEQGQPTDFIHNILSYKDLDLTSPSFKQHMMGVLNSMIPASSKVDQTILAKHLADFLKSKGTYESFQFIMRAVYGEEIEMDWNAEKLFRASANEYSREATVAIISSTGVWDDVAGSTLIQTEPTPATGSIESCISTTVNGKLIQWIKLNPLTLTGVFHKDGKVKALHNGINRNWYYEEEYYSPVSLVNGTLTFRAVQEENRPYENLIVRQLNGDYRAVVTSFVSRVKKTNGNVVNLTVHNETGTFSRNKELYIIAPALENTMYLKTDFEQGTVSHSIGNVRISTPGFLYTPSDNVTFKNGSGVNASAEVAEVSGGPIDNISIIKKGYGYAVGDKLSVSEEGYGRGLDIEVSKIDGVGADIKVISELNTLSITADGYEFKVNDELEIIGGTRVPGTPPAKIRVDAIDSSWALSDIRVTSPGVGYPPYTRVALVDTDTTTKVAGFAAEIIYLNNRFERPGGSIHSIAITSSPVIATNNLAIAINGYGATATATLSGSILSVASTNVGTNYVDPVVEVIGDGYGAVIRANKTGDTVTSYTVLNGGASYTTATIVVRERYGFNASAVPVLRSVTSSHGSISTFTILERGDYITLPPCHNAMLRSMGTGSLARASFDFKAKSAYVEDGGQYYHAATTSISGRGTGAVLVAQQVGGVITNIAILNGGKDYYHGTTVSIPGGATQCSLQPVIYNGKIVSVTIIDGGTGYTPPELLGITIGSGTSIVLNTTIAGTGKVVNSTIMSGGAGYLSQAELTPLSISLSGGTGAKFLPSINDLGEIERVDVLEGGEGYTIGDVFTVAGGGGSAVSLTPVVYQGRVTDVIVENPGYNYKYGTYAYVVGDGNGAVITPVVETGITSVEIADGGESYAATTTVNVIDTSGTGAVVRPTIVNGKITDLQIIRKGSGYVNPTLALSNVGSGSGAVLSAHAARHIKSLTVTNAGVGYTYADIVLVGDGEGFDAAIQVEKLGTIETVSVGTAGVGYTSTPLVTITDNSNYGAVSEIKTVNAGGGYSQPPIIYLPKKYDVFGALIASGTKFICHGRNVGGVRRVRFTNHGAEYHESPKVIFPMKAILKEPAVFKVGETIRIQRGSYREELVSTKILLEDGSRLISEGDSIDPIVQDMDARFEEVGLTATIRAFDPERHIIEFENLSDDFYFVNHAGDKIVSHNGSFILDSASGTFDVGDVIKGEKSFARATISIIGRAKGEAITNGSGFSDYKYINNVGLLNNSLSILPDNNRYQDNAYVISTGRSLVDYAKTLKDTVHPAGYAMFGDVKTQTLVDSGILREIGYNSFASLLIILSYFTPSVNSLHSSLDELYGDFTKFNMTDLSIDSVKDLMFTQVTKQIRGNITQYPAVPINSTNVSSWTNVNSTTVTPGYDYNPRGTTKNAFKIGDSSTSKTSSLTFNINTATAGQVYTFELYIKKQINPLTYPEIKLGTTLVRFNTETGEYYSNYATDLEVKFMGDWWFVRIKYVATVTSNILAVIYPARGIIGNLLTVSDLATGNITIFQPIIREVSGLSGYTDTIRVDNKNNYLDVYQQFYNINSDIVVV